MRAVIMQCRLRGPRFSIFSPRPQIIQSSVTRMWLTSPLKTCSKIALSDLYVAACTSYRQTDPRRPTLAAERAFEWLPPLVLLRRFSHWPKCRWELSRIGLDICAHMRSYHHGQLQRDICSAKLALQPLHPPQIHCNQSPTRSRQYNTAHKGCWTPGSWPKRD